MSRLGLTCYLPFYFKLSSLIRPAQDAILGQILVRICRSSEKVLLSMSVSDFIVQKSTLTRILSYSLSDCIREKGMPIPLKTVWAVRFLLQVLVLQLSHKIFGNEPLSSLMTVSWASICEKKSASVSDSKQK